MLNTDNLWRFQAVIFDIIDPKIQYLWDNPVPIKSWGRIIGFASLYLEDERGHAGAPRIRADCAVEYAITERLDYEGGKWIYALPFCEVDLVTLSTPVEQTTIEIKHLELRYDCNNSNIPPVATLIL